MALMQTQEIYIYICTYRAFGKDMMKDTKVLEILADYGLKLKDLSEPEWQQMNMQTTGHFDVDEPTMHRIARVAAVNKVLKKQNGCEPLAWTEVKEQEQQEEDEKEKQQREAVRLTRAEWCSVRGHHGLMLGVPLSATAFARMWRKCKTKKALSLRGNVESSKKFLLEELKKVANAIIKWNAKMQSPASQMQQFQKNAKAVVTTAKKSSASLA